MGNRNVGELDARGDALQQHSAASHVAMSEELARENEPGSENRLQDVDVLAGRDASKQDDLTLRPDVGGKRRRVALQW